MTAPTPPQAEKLWPASRIAITGAVIIISAALLGILASQLLKGGRGIDAALSAGKATRAPDFDLDVLNTGTLRPELASLRPAFADGRLTRDELLGTPVVLNFWASWCEPCRTEAPALASASERTRGVLFLGLNSLDAASKALAFVGEYDLSYPNIREGDNAVTRSYGSTGLPETFFIDAKGQIVAHVAGAISPKQLAAGITAARTSDPAAALKAPG